MSKNRIKNGDLVVVVTGKRSKSDYDKEPRKVLKTLFEKNLVIVEGHRILKKHIRPTKENPKGGRIEKEAPVHISNVMIYCSKCEQGVRVGFKIEDKKKQRVCRGCGEDV